VWVAKTRIDVVKKVEVDVENSGWPAELFKPLPVLVVVLNTRKIVVAVLDLVVDRPEFPDPAEASLT
jgi:hypothetical protein